jgi:hypothetical protein
MHSMESIDIELQSLFVGGEYLYVGQGLAEAEKEASLMMHGNDSTFNTIKSYID